MTEQREKIARIAEEIMAWHKEGEIPSWVDERGASMFDVEWPYDNLWDPFSEVNQAMMIAERLRELGYHVEIMLWPTLWTDEPTTVRIVKGPKVWKVSADTLAAAIAEASHQVADAMRGKGE